MAIFFFDVNSNSNDGCSFAKRIIRLRERLTTRPGKLINENRTAFIRLGCQLDPSTSRFIIAFKLNANIIIHHQAALAPKAELPIDTPIY